MQTDAYRLWSSRIVTFVMAALAAASAVYWGLKGWAPATPSLVPVLAQVWAPPIGSQAVAQALGGGQALAAPSAPTAPAVSRYALVGVLAGRAQGGAALISVDGQEALPIRIGEPVGEGLVLQSVTGRRAVLSSSVDAPAKLTLELPPLDE